MLMVDNDQDFLETRAERLEEAGYDVYTAVSIEEAEHILEHTNIHVIVVDLRMRDDNDDKDTTGLFLAEKDAYESIPKIILTRYPSYQHVRKALGPVIEGLPPAVDFIAKQEGQDSMLDAVQRAFDTYVPINHTLSITWKEVLSFYLLVDLIAPETAREHLTDRTAELEDLFRRLFHDTTQVTIGRLLARSEGRVMLEVFAYRHQSGEVQLVVACGRRDLIRQEDGCFEHFAPHHGGAGSTAKWKTAETGRFAATTYTLVGGELAETASFRDFYRNRPVREVEAALDSLSSDTLARWHRQRRFHEADHSPVALYRDWLELSDEALLPARLQRCVDAIGAESVALSLAAVQASPHRLVFQIPGGPSVSYPNPIPDLATGRIVGDPPLLCGISHGRVDADTVLVDGHARTWLIDFTHAGRGPLLRDYLSLELVIKLDLIETPDLLGRHTLEQRLLAATTLADPLPSEGLSPELRKALSAIERIRHSAAQLEPRDIKPYLLGLFFAAIKRVASFNPDLHYSRRELAPAVHG
ncbi:MAG TPA: hypothetical protein DEP84_07580, partial [Chloroflexi bacterium]|nr:hypothetical protein [Chloroflexota bacterium]